MSKVHHVYEPALMLTGGGARAAYQVGVLKGVASLVPRAHPLPFRILAGTSAGALNAAAMAGYASNFHLAVKKVEQVWANFSTDQVYRCSTGEVFGHLISRVGRMFQSESSHQHAASLFDNQPLRELIERVVDFKKVDRQISRGYLRALAVTASCYNNGHSISFFEGHPNYHNWKRANREGVRTRLTKEHLMASAAIPLIFPAIELQHKYFGDGAIHQISPLSPAIHLGASKIMVIGVDQPHMEEHLQRQYTPSSATIAGHLLDTIFADTLNSDVERLQRINGTIRELNKAGVEHPDLRLVDTLIIKPQLDFNELAHRHYERMPKAVRRLLGLVGVNHDTPSSIVSYLLFEKEYCQELMDIGYADALKREDDIHRFLELGGRPIV
ncbi:patatin-like phospholipase family protein [Aliidiomarina maris]|uniref:NTE family protein n=2 Tax=Aliidiomarina maris TaxID=531312 RepID=A0A327X7S3_9GAMM|nr:NTE family protein [Aliidiomarina maris]